MSAARGARARWPGRPGAVALAVLGTLGGTARAELRAQPPDPGCAAAAPRGPATPSERARFDYDRAAPLAVQLDAGRDSGGVRVHRLSFAAPRGDRATGWLYVPADSLRARDGRFAGVLLLHGAPGDATGMAFVAWPTARAGAVVASIDAPFVRRDPRRPVTLAATDSAETVEYVRELRRAVDVLLARPDVDPARLGAVGISYGGATGALLAGVERRLAAYVLAVADGGLAEHFSDAGGAPRPAPEGVAPEQWCRWFASVRPISALRFLPGAALEGRGRPALLFQWGRRDALVPPYLAERLWQAAPAPKDSLWYDSGHGLPARANAERLAWLARQLGLRAPTP